MTRQSTRDASGNSSSGDESFVHNPHLVDLADDHLYHLGIHCGQVDVKAEYGHVKFVCVGGSASRMEKLTDYFAKHLTHEHPAKAVANLSNAPDRYHMYKTGPVLCLNHGIGVPSMSVVLLEVFKLLHYAGCTDVTFFRLGTSGGLGLEPGTVVVSTHALNSELQPVLQQRVFGKERNLDATFDNEIVNELMSYEKDLPFPLKTGATLGTDCFYEGQGRLDGAFCDYEQEDKFEFLKDIYENHGVRNIEMESVGFAALCRRANVRAAICCVTILDRLNGDQVNTAKETLKEWETRPAQLAVMYMRKHWPKAIGNKKH